MTRRRRALLARGGIAGRIALWAGALTLALLVVAALLMRGALYSSRMEATERLAGSQADQIADAVQAGEPVSGGYGALPYVLVRGDGAVVAASGEFSWPGDAPSLPIPPPSTERFVGGRWPVVITAGPLAGRTLTAISGTFMGPSDGLDGSSDDTPYRVYVMATTDAADATVAVLDPFLWGSVLLVVVLVAGTAAVAVRRALRPVERMRRAADAVSGAPAGARIDEPAVDDELRALARTLNGMLERIDEASARQARFIADAAHELRTPLSSLLAALEVARAHPGSLSPDEVLRHVETEAQRLRVLADDLLDLTVSSAGGAGSEDRVDAVEVVSEALDRRRARVPKRVRLAAELPTTPLVVGLRGPQLERVVENLLDNGLRHARSLVVVRLDRVPSEEGSFVRLEVQNDGPAVAEQDRERIFEPFVRLDEARTRDDGGTGLGLAITRAILTQAGGTITVSTPTTRPARGAVFTAILPKLT
ncbi:hypothetical protein C5C39_02195 [Rathayibacter sp. AY1F3]|uniref:HAMP domain-containing sensor histidine kinase n=1 Tax=Rathayibacter sp. AY1F3 TaxID=2080558 RepID=UPI000CE8392A|nr:HAMP domain-containing sensor histidine kinase [Rathayibacter sp. AY1F3]PPG92842.1 hypothetical protein C5C39_02195 [Rathayibacter sp. AY1F3]